MPFPRVLEQSKIQKASLRISTQSDDSISYNDTSYAKHASKNEYWIRHMLKMNRNSHAYLALYMKGPGHGCTPTLKQITAWRSMTVSYYP